MKLSEIGFSFENLRKRIKPTKVNYYSLPSPLMVDACRSDDSDFCHETVASGILTESQMRQAAERYRLGKSRSGKCIFWMIDEREGILDGRIDSPTMTFDDAHPIWISLMLKAREPDLLSFWQAPRCLFGLHLLSERGSGKSVAIVESERSAVILSELFPQFVWLAYVNALCFTIDMLKPLKGRKVVLYPPTDSTGSTYLFWYDIADRARKCYHLDISVSYLLEDKATPQQKESRIDLVGLLFDNASEFCVQAH